MSKNYTMEDMAEEGCQTTVEVGYLGYKFMYNVLGFRDLSDAYKDFTLFRLDNRIRKYLDRYDDLTKEQRNIFNKSLKSDPQNRNYFYEFFEKARSTMYDMHSALLFRILVDFAKNRELTYFESNLLANINLLNDEDIRRIYYFLSKNRAITSLDESVRFDIESYEDIQTFNKCLQLGIVIVYERGMQFGEGQKIAIQSKWCYLTKGAFAMLKLLNDIIDD